MEEIFAGGLLREQAVLRDPVLWQAAEAARPGLERYPLTMEQYRQWLSK